MTAAGHCWSNEVGWWWPRRLALAVLVPWLWGTVQPLSRWHCRSDEGAGWVRWLVREGDRRWGARGGLSHKLLEARAA